MGPKHLSGHKVPLSSCCSSFVARLCAFFLNKSSLNVNMCKTDLDLCTVVYFFLDLEVLSLLKHIRNDGGPGGIAIVLGVRFICLSSVFVLLGVVSRLLYRYTARKGMNNDRKYSTEYPVGM